MGCRTILLVGALSFSFLASAQKPRPSLRGAACETLKVPLPALNPGRDFDRNAFSRDGLLYLLATWIPDVTNAVGPSDPEMTVPCAPLPPTVQIALINSLLPDGSFDYNRFRNALGAPYLEARSRQHRAYSPPATLAEFKAATGFEQWPVEVVTRSRIKDFTRAVYHSPAGAPYTVSIAVTHDSQSGDLTTAVRETEFLLRREDGSKNWDFYVYDATGKLATQSHFGRNLMPAPSICMNCHYDSADRAFVPLMRR